MQVNREIKYNKIQYPVVAQFGRALDLLEWCKKHTQVEVWVQIPLLTQGFKWPQVQVLSTGPMKNN